MQRLFVQRSTLLLLSLLGIAAGCGEAPDRGGQPAAAGAPATDDPTPAPSAEARPADVCALVSDEEFRQATGFAVASKKGFSGEVPGCDWELVTDMPALHRLSLNLRFEGGRQRYDFVTNTMPAIPDLGDAAAKTGGNINGTVWAVKGDTLATLNYSLPVATADPDAVVVPLLRLVLSRL